MKCLKKMILAGLFVGIIFSSASTGALIYESFDYSTGSVVGQDGGQGWGSAWTQPQTDGTEEVVADSLSFSDYQTSGGALKLVDTDPDWGVIGVRRQLGMDFNTGDDVWVSYLSKIDVVQSSNASRTAEFRHGPTAGTTKLRMQPKGTNSQGVMVAYDSDGNNSAGENVQDGRTYLTIVRFGDIGTADGKYAVMWVFDEAGYDAMMADGTITESELNTNDYITAQDPHANRTLGTADSAYLLLANSQGDDFGYYFDELRYGTSLDQVLVPEPMSVFLLGMGGIALISRRK
jgi:hypothetical protein